MTREKLKFQPAIDRSIAYKLIKSPPRFSSPSYLSDEKLRSEITAVCHSFAPGRFTGMCLVMAQQSLHYIKARLNCNAWIELGWLSDISMPGSFFWKMDADELCNTISRGQVAIGEFHAWIALDSGEIIDPVVYPTLAELFPRKFSRGSGRCNFLMPEGRPYKVTPGLPLLQYNTQAFWNPEAAIER